MAAWLTAHLATVLICLVLAAMVVLILLSLIRDRKKGKSSCGCGWRRGLILRLPSGCYRDSRQGCLEWKENSSGRAEEEANIFCTFPAACAIIRPKAGNGEEMEG